MSELKEETTGLSQVEEVASVENKLSKFNLLPSRSIYKVRNTSGLYYTIGRLKNGNVLIRPINDLDKKLQVKDKDLECLGDLVIRTHEEGKAFVLDQVFASIEELGLYDILKDYLNAEKIDLNPEGSDDAASVIFRECADKIVPNYNHEHFKGYHFKQLLKWYDIRKPILDKLREDFKFLQPENLKFNIKVDGTDLEVNGSDTSATILNKLEKSVGFDLIKESTGEVVKELDLLIKDESYITKIKSDEPKEIDSSTEGEVNS